MTDNERKEYISALRHPSGNIVRGVLNNEVY